jgi:Ca2+-binding EF-hand superfamily protein
MTRREIGFLVLMAVGFVRVGAAAVVQDQDTDSLRASYEAQFESFDDNNDGALDESELENVPDSDLADMHAHGLPASVPVSREAFVASGVATALAAIAGSNSDTKKEMDDKRGREGTKPSRDEPEKAKSAEVKPTGTTPAPTTRFPGRKSHFVPELPAEFTVRDKNGDGQIALYEWDRKKYSEFAKLDKNGDGFLTPSELLPAEALKILYAKATGRPVPAAPGPGTSSNGGAPGTAAAGTPGDDTEKEARNTFAGWDKNKNGTIEEDEWAQSTRTRQGFERTSIKISLPMNADAFVPLYRRYKEAERSERSDRPERSDRR